MERAAFKCLSPHLEVTGYITPGSRIHVLSFYCTLVYIAYAVYVYPYALCTLSCFLRRLCRANQIALIDFSAKFSSHIANLTSSCRVLLYNVLRTWPFLSMDATHVFHQSLIISRLDSLAGLFLHASNSSNCSRLQLDNLSTSRHYLIPPLSPSSI